MGYIITPCGVLLYFALYIFFHVFNTYFVFVFFSGFYIFNFNFIKYFLFYSDLCKCLFIIGGWFDSLFTYLWLLKCFYSSYSRRYYRDAVLSLFCHWFRQTCEVGHSLFPADLLRHQYFLWMSITPSTLSSSFLANVLRKGHLRLSDSKFNCPFSSHFLRNIFVAQMFSSIVFLAFFCRNANAIVQHWLAYRRRDLT